MGSTESMARPRVGVLLVLATALVCNQAEQSNGDPLSVQELSSQHASEELEDQQTVQDQQQEGIDALNELHLAAQEVQFNSEARSDTDNASAKKRRTERDASAEEHSKLAIAQEKFTQAMADAKVALTRQNNLIKERGNRDKLDIVKRKQDQLIENVRQWKAKADQVRESTNQLYHQAEAQYNRELAAAEQIRTHALETENAKAESEMKEAAAAAEAQQHAIRKNLESALAKNLREKAEYIQNGGLTLPTVTLLQESPETDTGSVLSAAFAKDRLRAEEEAASAKAKAEGSEGDSELAQMKAEHRAEQTEAEAFSEAEQTKKSKRDAANQNVEEAKLAANNALKWAKAKAKQEFEKSSAGAELSALNEKKAAKQKKADAYTAADEREEADIRAEKLSFENSAKRVEEARESTVSNAKKLLDEKLESIDAEEAAETAHATQIMERTVAQADARADREKKGSLESLKLEPQVVGGGVSLIQTEESVGRDEGLYDLNPTDSYMRMSAEEMVKHNQEQSAADEQTVKQSIEQFEKQGREATEREQLDAAKSQEDDEGELIESQTKKNTQAAETFAEEALARVKMAHVTEKDRILKRAQAQELKIEGKATAEKLEETQRKETLYSEASKEWRLAKKRARDEELATFKQVEADEEKQLLAAHQEKVATLKAAAADRDAKKAEATKAKNEAIAAAEKTKSEAIAAASNAKTAVMKQLELKMAEEPQEEAELEGVEAAPKEPDAAQESFVDDIDEQPDPIE